MAPFGDGGAAFSGRLLSDQILHHLSYKPLLHYSVFIHFGGTYKSLYIYMHSFIQLCSKSDFGVQSKFSPLQRLRATEQTKT